MSENGKRLAELRLEANEVEKEAGIYIRINKTAARANKLTRDLLVFSEKLVEEIETKK